MLFSVSMIDHDGDGDVDIENENNIKKLF